MSMSTSYIYICVCVVGGTLINVLGVFVHSCTFLGFLGEVGGVGEEGH